MAPKVSSRVRDSAFWIYGVIVGVVLKDTLAIGLPHLLGLSTTTEYYANRAASMRAVAIWILSIRFYLGAVVHFDENYPNEGESGRDYLLDFIIGLIHFSAFYGLVVTIEQTGDAKALFCIIFGCILLYDFPWCLLTKTTLKMRIWTVVNFLTVLVGSSVMVTMVKGVGFGYLAVEFWVLLGVSLVGVGDMAATIRGRPFFENGFKRILKDD